MKDLRTVLQPVARVLFAALLTLDVSRAADNEPPPGYIPLFNGKDLTGARAAAAAATALPAHSNPPPAPPTDVSAWGLHIQRPMTLLATSTPEKRHTVRILFYGQSITRSMWTELVTEDLRRRFPHADIVAKNLAIGGFASQLLSQTVDNDIALFNPDLIIFHVYGAHAQYEQIVAAFRSRTAAQVALQTDHLTAKPGPRVPDGRWTGFMNGSLVPAVAARYGCQHLFIREPWRQYVIANDLEPKELLADGVHLNEQGDRLMADLVGRQLVYRPDLPDDSWRDLVRTVEVGTDVSFVGGTLTMEFTGNRVDAVAAAGTSGAAEILVDGKRPSEFPTAYAVTRANDGPDVDWPWTVGAPYRIEYRTPWQAEDWTITITEGETATFAFEVAGSKTGADGKGTSDREFVSPSGRIVIKPDWWTKLPPDGRSPRGPGYVLKFSTILLGTDRYTPPPITDAALEAATTLVQGIPNGKHVLTIRAIGDHPPAIAALRVYRPPLERMPAAFPTAGMPAPPPRTTAPLTPRPRSASSPNSTRTPQKQFPSSPLPAGAGERHR